MIRIKTENGNLELSPETSFEWIQTNNLFENDVNLSSNITLPFNIPYTPVNSKLLGSQEVHQKSSVILSKPATLYIEGHKFFPGQVNVLKASKQSGYDISLSYNRDEIDTDKSIRSFDYGAARIGTDKTSRKDTNDLFYPETDHVWPEFYNESDDAEAWFSADKLILNFYGGATTAFTDKDATVPMMFLPYILKHAVKSGMKLQATGTFLKRIKDYLIYNPVHNVEHRAGTIDLVAYSDYVGRAEPFKLWVYLEDLTNYSMPTGSTVSFTFHKITSYGPFTTAQINASYVTVPGDADPHVFMQNFEIYLLTFGLVAMFSDYANPDIPRIAFYNANLTGGTYTDNNQRTAIDVSFVNASVYHDVKPANHIPDLTLKELLEAVNDFGALVISMDALKGTLRFTPKVDYMTTSEYKDYTPQLLEGSESYLEDTAKLRFRFKNDEKDERTADEYSFKWHCNSNPEHYAPGWEHFDIECATTDVKNLQNSNAGLANMPIVNQKMNTYDDIDNEDDQDFTLRLLNWKGMVQDSAAFVFPQATDDKLTPNEAFGKWWALWYNFLVQGKSLVEMPLNLTLNDIINFDPSIKWKIKHNHYIWKQIRTLMSKKNGVEPSIATVVKLRHAQLGKIIDQGGGGG